jgi:hypothetical protein
LPVAEPEVRPRPRVRRESEAAVERAGAATGTGGEVMKMVEPVEMPLPSHPHILSCRDLGAPQTSNHDVCAPRETSYVLFALIPGGDQLSSRGQRPRKTRPQQGPTLKGSNTGGVTPVLRPAAQGNTTPSGSGNERRLSGGVAPGYYLVPLQGTKKLPFGLTLRPPFLTSRIAAFGYPWSE